VPCHGRTSCGAGAVQIGEVASILFSSGMWRSAANLNSWRSRSSIFKKTDPKAKRVSAKNYVKSFSFFTHMSKKNIYKDVQNQVDLQN
jgi:hypothetical protein